MFVPLFVIVSVPFGTVRMRNPSIAIGVELVGRPLQHRIGDLVGSLLEQPPLNVVTLLRNGATLIRSTRTQGRVE